MRLTKELRFCACVTVQSAPSCGRRRLSFQTRICASDGERAGVSLYKCL